MSQEISAGAPAPAAAAANTTPSAAPAAVNTPATTTPAAATSNVPGGTNGHTQEVRAAETTTPGASKFSAEIVEQAKTFGVALDGFSDEANAKFAIKQAIERFAHVGLNRPTQQQPAAEEVIEDDGGEEIDTATLDPKVAAYLNRIKQQAAENQRRVEAIEQQNAQFQQQQQREAMRDTIGRIIKTIDEYALPEFGVGEHLTVSQQIERRTLMETAAAIVNGMIANGLSAPSPEMAVQMAMTARGKEPVKRAAKAQSPSMVPGGTLAPGVGKPSLQYFKSKPEYDALGITQTDTFQRGLAEIFASHS